MTWSKVYAGEHELCTQSLHIWRSSIIFCTSWKIICFRNIFGSSGSCLHPLTDLRFLSFYVQVWVFVEAFPSCGLISAAHCVLSSDVEGLGLFRDFLRVSSGVRRSFRQCRYHLPLRPVSFLTSDMPISRICLSLLFEQWPWLVVVFAVSQCWSGVHCLTPQLRPSWV